MAAMRKEGVLQPSQTHARVQKQKNLPLCDYYSFALSGISDIFGGGKQAGPLETGFLFCSLIGEGFRARDAVVILVGLAINF